MHKTLKRTNPSVFHSFFTLRSEITDQHTRGVDNNQLVAPTVKTSKFGLNSLKYKMIKHWNELVRCDFKMNSPLNSETTDLISIAKNHLFSHLEK